MRTISVYSLSRCTLRSKGTPCQFSTTMRPLVPNPSTARRPPDRRSSVAVLWAISPGRAAKYVGYAHTQLDVGGAGRQPGKRAEHLLPPGFPHPEHFVPQSIGVLDDLHLLLYRQSLPNGHCQPYALSCCHRHLIKARQARCLQARCRRALARGALLYEPSHDS